MAHDTITITTITAKRDENDEGDDDNRQTIDRLYFDNDVHYKISQ